MADQCNPDNPLPYGGITDIHGNIIKAFTKEEEDAALAKVRKAFGKGIIEITIDADLLFYAIGNSTKKRGPAPDLIRSRSNGSFLMI